MVNLPAMLSIRKVIISLYNYFPYYVLKKHKLMIILITATVVELVEARQDNKNKVMASFGCFFSNVFCLP